MISFILFPIFLGALLFIPSNTLDWSAAWVYIIIFMCFEIAIVSWLRMNDPRLLKDQKTFMKKSAKLWDKIIILASTVLFIILFTIPGFDLCYQWSHTPIFLSVTGFFGIVSSFVFVFLVIRENTYLSRVVEIQTDRGHAVITTGPYRYVRHPMYLGVIVMFFCTPLALGSLYGLIPALLLAIIIGIRTHFEDKMLHRELPGYKDYAKKTPYRLFPRIW
jgi:protein-S-isoprenylcysteine O-methyltransferase Ste14